jgi:acetyl esterase
MTITTMVNEPTLQSKFEALLPRIIDFAEQAKYLASRGMVCIQVEYRVIRKSVPDELPIVCIQDAKSAMRWVRSHALELGIDPNRIAASGGSAGGHLAAFVGIMDTFDDPKDDLAISPRANALVLFNPVFDNSKGNFGYDRVGERFKEFSPALNVSAKSPPSIVFVGSEDTAIRPAKVEAFKAAMDKAGIRCDIHIYEGQPHGFFNYREGNRYYTVTLRTADEFLAGLGWLKGPPTLPKLDTK